MAEPPQTLSSSPPQSPSPPSDERIFAALSYVAFLFILTIITKPRSEYCRFHAKQGMVLFLITIVVLMVLATIPFIGSLFTLALFALYVLALYRAYRGDRWKIPFIGDIAGKINLDELLGKAGLAEAVGQLREQASAVAQKVSQSITQTGSSEGKSEEKNQNPPKT